MQLYTRTKADWWRNGRLACEKHGILIDTSKELDVDKFVMAATIQMQIAETILDLLGKTKAAQTKTNGNGIEMAMSTVAVLRLQK